MNGVAVAVVDGDIAGVAADGAVGVVDAVDAVGVVGVVAVGMVQADCCWNGCSSVAGWPLG